MIKWLKRLGLSFHKHNWQVLVDHIDADSTSRLRVCMRCKLHHNKWSSTKGDGKIKNYYYYGT